MSAATREHSTARAKDILKANDRGGYTVPTARLYPFQWNWDSAFVAMGFATYDIDRAYRELEMLASSQWADGMMPQIIFRTPSDDYFPGPDVWKTQGRSPAGGPPTSGITQPPVLGMALRRVHEASAGDSARQARTLPLFHAALRNHRWWLTARDPERTGLVAILHNWETGSDNSPAWDLAFERVPTTTATTIVRKDTGHVDASMRPRDIDYKRYIHLVDTYAAVGWEPAQQWTVTPFKIAEVQCTAILARATEDLIALSYSLGTPAEQAELLDMHERLTTGLKRQWRETLSRFCSRDLISGSDILTPTHAGFVPLLALDLDASQKIEIAAEMERWLAGTKVGLPTVPITAPTFEAKRYWRGPVWAIMNWLLIDGLERNGLDALAQRLRAGTIAAAVATDFAEYFDPLTGEGCGGPAFSWTAATYLHLTRTT